MIELDQDYLDQLTADDEYLRRREQQRLNHWHPHDPAYVDDEEETKLEGGD